MSPTDTKSIHPAIVIIFFALLGISVPVFATKHLVGTSHTYKAPSAVASIVKDGDTVEIEAGTYANETATWRANNLTLRATARFARLSAPATIPNQKAIWVIQGKNTVIENIEFFGAKVPDKNGAGIRQEGENCTIRHCFFHDNEDGILTSASASSCIVIEYTEFADNGHGDGYSHNIYIGHIARFTLRYCHTHHAKIGHTVKSRADTNFLLYNRIMDEADGTASYEIDLPNGGTSYLIGNLIQQGPATDNSTIVSYGAEGLINAGKDLYVVNNTIVNDRSSGIFVRIAAGAARANVTNNLFVGPGTLVSGPADTLSNLSTASPGFADKAAYDYRLTASSPAINKGCDPGAAHGYPLRPGFQYSYDCSAVPRPQNGQLDIGAFEFGAMACKHAAGVAGIPRPASRCFIDLLGRTIAPEFVPARYFPNRKYLKAPGRR